MLFVLIHDCLRILKYLGKYQPFQQLHFGVNNLYLRDGRVCLADPYISRQNLVKELSQINREKLASKEPPGGKSEERQPARFHRRFWQIQNLNFIASLACRLLTLDHLNDTEKLIKNVRVKQSHLYPVIKQIIKALPQLALNENET